MMDQWEKKSSFWAKLILLFGFAAVGVIIFSASKEVYQKKEVNSEIESLKEEARKIQRENLDLESKLSYLQSRDYQEKEAKDKLNLKNPNENLVVIKPNLARGGNEKNEPKEDKLVLTDKHAKVPNPLKWWNYFFKY